MRKANPELLKEDYIRLDGRLKEVAELHGLHEWTVWDNLKRHYPEVLKHGFKGKTRATKEQLEQWYVAEMMSLTQIAEKCGTHAPLVARWLRKNGIPVRDRDAENRRLNSKTENFTPDVELLRKKYVDEGKSVEQVAKEIGSSRRFVENQMRDHGIEIRPRIHVQIATGMRDPFISKFTTGYIDMPNGEKFLYQSSYEQRFLERSIEENLEIQRWRKHVGIPYSFKETAHNYYPDFIASVNGTEYVLEIKSSTFLKDTKTRAKIRAGFYYGLENGTPYRLLLEVFLGIKDTHFRQSRTKLREWAEEVERAGDEPFLKFLLELEESYNSPTKPRLLDYIL